MTSYPFGCSHSPFVSLIHVQGLLRELLVDSRKPLLGESPLSQDDMLNFSVQLAQGVACLASHGVTHRALACKNVLVSANQQIKIAKLGRHVPEAELEEALADATVPVQSPYLVQAAKLGIGSDMLRWMVRGWGGLERS